jgi:hypothetical protein
MRRIEAEGLIWLRVVETPSLVDVTIAKTVANTYNRAFEKVRGTASTITIIYCAYDGTGYANG